LTCAESNVPALEQLPITFHGAKGIAGPIRRDAKLSKESGSAETVVIDVLISGRCGWWDAVVLSFDKLGAGEATLGERSGSCAREDALRSGEESEEGRSDEEGDQARDSIGRRHLG